MLGFAAEQALKDGDTGVTEVSETIFLLANLLSMIHYTLAETRYFSVNGKAAILIFRMKNYIYNQNGKTTYLGAMEHTSFSRIS